MPPPNASTATITATNWKTKKGVLSADTLENTLPAQIKGPERRQKCRAFGPFYIVPGPLSFYVIPDKDRIYFCCTIE